MYIYMIILIIIIIFTCAEAICNIQENIKIEIKSSPIAMYNVANNQIVRCATKKIHQPCMCVRIYVYILLLYVCEYYVIIIYVIVIRVCECYV